MPWDYKYQEFSSANNWWQSSTNNVPTEIEFEPQKFQRYIKRVRGRKYHRTTIRKALLNLVEKSRGLIVILKDYGKGVFKLMIYPLSYLSENGSSNRDSSHSAAAEKPFVSEAFKENQKSILQQQQKYIDQIDTLLRKVGLKFDQDALLNIYRLSGKSIDRVVKSIELLLYRNSKKQIARPHGFIMDCLRKRWCDGFDIYYQPELPVFQTITEIKNFVTDIQSSIKPSRGKIRRGKKEIGIHQQER